MLAPSIGSAWHPPPRGGAVARPAVPGFAAGLLLGALSASVVKFPWRKKDLFTVINEDDLNMII